MADAKAVRVKLIIAGQPRWVLKDLRMPRSVDCVRAAYLDLSGTAILLTTDHGGTTDVELVLAAWDVAASRGIAEKVFWQNIVLGWWRANSDRPWPLS